MRPDFVRLLRDGLGIVTCADVIKRFDQLCFSVNADVFRFCYRLIHGQGKFDEEHRVMIFSPEHCIIRDKILLYVAMNKSSIVTATRTGYQNTGVIRRMVTMRGEGTCFPVIDSQLNYGRLITDEQFMDIVRRTVIICLVRLHKKSQLTASARILIRPVIASRPTFAKSFPPTDDHDTIMAHVMELGSKIAPLRHHVGYESGDKVYTLHVSLSALQQAPILPSHMNNEINDIKKLFRECRTKIMSSTLYRQTIRRHDRVLSRSRKNSSVAQAQPSSSFSRTVEGNKGDSACTQSTTDETVRAQEGDDDVQSDDDAAAPAVGLIDYTSEDANALNSAVDTHHKVQLLV